MKETDGKDKGFRIIKNPPPVYEGGTRETRWERYAKSLREKWDLDCATALDLRKRFPRLPIVVSWER